MKEEAQVSELRFTSDELISNIMELNQHPDPARIILQSLKNIDPRTALTELEAFVEAWVPKVNRLTALEVSVLQEKNAEVIKAMANAAEKKMDDLDLRPLRREKLSRQMPVHLMVSANIAELEKTRALYLVILLDEPEGRKAISDIPSLLLRVRNIILKCNHRYILTYDTDNFNENS